MYHEGIYYLCPAANTINNITVTLSIILDNCVIKMCIQLPHAVGHFKTKTQ